MSKYTHTHTHKTRYNLPTFLRTGQDFPWFYLLDFRPLAKPLRLSLRKLTAGGERILCWSELKTPLLELIRWWERSRWPHRVELRRRRTFLYKKARLRKIAMAMVSLKLFVFNICVRVFTIFPWTLHKGTGKDGEIEDRFTVLGPPLMGSSSY